jgi:hypothetical protein
MPDQVSQLSAGIRAARMQSSVELLGRRRLAEGEAPPPLGPADPAARILEALLALPDHAARLALLPEAFKAPEPAEAIEVMFLLMVVVSRGYHSPWSEGMPDQASQLALLPEAFRADQQNAL